MCFTTTSPHENHSLSPFRHQNPQDGRTGPYTTRYTSTKILSSPTFKCSASPSVPRAQASPPSSACLALPQPVGHEAGPNRLTSACYCGLDSHYLLVIAGLGLMLTGLTIVWSSERHVRPSWLLARSGYVMKTRALDDCRLRVKTILQKTYPGYLNHDLLRRARHNSRIDGIRMEQLVNRFYHEKTQISRQYLSELCAVERVTKPKTGSSFSRTNVNQVDGNVTEVSCILLDRQTSRVNAQRRFPSSDSINAELLTPERCIFTSVHPAVQESLRTRAANYSKAVHVDSSLAGSSEDVLFDDYTDVLTSARSDDGVLNLITNVYSLTLTGVIVSLSMGSLLVYTQLGYLILLRIWPPNNRQSRTNMYKAITTVHTETCLPTLSDQSGHRLPSVQSSSEASSNQQS